MEYKVVHTVEIPDSYSVVLKQNNVGRFMVVYGGTVYSDLNYQQAAQEFGECVFHALACAGKIETD